METDCAGTTVAMAAVKTENGENLKHTKNDLILTSNQVIFTTLDNNLIDILVTANGNQSIYRFIRRY